MNKVLFSSIAAIALTSTVYANSIKLYTNPSTGQIFTKNAPGRIPFDINNLVHAKAKKTKSTITIVDKNSPNFLLGKQTHIGMKITAQDDPNMWIKAGVRLQGTFENKQTSYKQPTTKSNTNIDSAYLRRVRFEFSAGFNKYLSYTMDIRNDKSNYTGKGEGHFNVGDAYIKIKKPFNTSLINFKLYRAKIDISRTETVKSARTIMYDRPYIADEAAQFISYNRRATNVQMYGNYKDKIHYQIAAGSSVYQGKLHDTLGESLSGNGGTISDQSFFYGGHVTFSPFNGWEQKKETETYFAQGKSFAFGAGYWSVPTIQGHTSSGVNFNLHHELINLSVTGHYHGFFASAEYFKFNGVVKNWANTGSLDTGSSNGGFVTGEYCFKNLAYLAPFVRYEKWNKFTGNGGNTLTSTSGGINWYLRGNTIKMGVNFQHNDYGINIGNKTENIARITSQWFF